MVKREEITVAVKHAGTVAPYLFDTECRWCTGRGAGTLSSSSFGSCVGLVLYGPRHKIGVVAHFSGSIGKNLRKARADTLEILRDVCPVLPGVWNAWVFGGRSLSDIGLHTGTRPMTKSLMDAIRETIRTNPYIPINVIASQLTAPEMRPGTYVGHGAVQLDLSDGSVSWPDDSSASSDASSGGSKQKYTNPYL